MKRLKSLTLYLILFILLISVAFFFITKQEETSLLPEVQAILNIQPLNEQEMDQNAYVYLMGITVADDNYQAVAKKELIAINQQIRYRLTQPPRGLEPYHPTKKPYPIIELKKDIAGIPYRFPCHNLANLHCINEIINKPELDSLLIANHTLLTRYQFITQLPFYKTYPEPIYDHSLFSTNYFMDTMLLSSFNQIIAIKLIEKGQIDQGLTILNNEMIFYKKILVGNARILDTPLALFLLLKNYHITEQLLDLPIMRKQLNNPKLLGLLKPLSSQEQQFLKSVATNNREDTLLLFALIKNIDLAISDYYINNYQKIIRHILFYLSYNKNKTLNGLYTKFIPSIEETSITLPDASAYYAKINTPEPIKDTPNLKELIYQYGIDNILGGLIIDETSIFYRTYSQRFYAAPTYLSLITAKLAIKQAHITKQQVPAFLKSLGEKAVNPYTQQPFVWDEEKQILSTDWPDRSPKPANIGNTAQVYIAFP